MRRILPGAVLALCAGHACAQLTYDFTLVNALLSNSPETYLYDIDDQGTAVGTTTGNTPIGTSYVGFIWNPASGPTQVPPSWPHGFNNTGLAVGVGTALRLGGGQA